MRTRLNFLMLPLALLTYCHGASAATIFPIAVNSNVVEVASGGATSGTNGLAAILSGTNVCFQLISTNGTLLGPLTTIGSGTSFPLVAFGGGNYLIYWDDNFIDSGSVFGQFISPGGALVGSAFAIGEAGESNGGVGAPRALASDGTNFLAVFENNNSYYGQLITSAGALTSSIFLINSQQGNGNSAAALFGKTNYLVVWQSNNGNNGNTNQTFGAFVSPSGSAGSPFQIGQTASLDQNPLAIALDGTNFFVVWNTDTTETASGAPIWSFYGRLISQSGTFPGSELLLNTNQPLSPSLAFDGANYLLGWGYDSDTTNADRNVFFQFFNSSADPIGPQFSIFPAQGTNVPLFAGVSFAGSRFQLVAAVGSLNLGTNGKIQGFASAATYGAFVPASTAPPQLTVPAAFPSGQFPLLLAGTPGINYAIQTATNPVSTNWSNLVTNSPTNGTFPFTDSNATNSSRFYRALKQ